MAADTTLSPAERTLRARAAAFSQHAQGKTNTGPATKGFQLRFERQVDPEGVLDPTERARRAKAAQSAYMAALSLRKSRRAGGAVFSTKTLERAMERDALRLRILAVFRVRAAGLGTNEVAEALGDVSNQAVRSHLAVMVKLGFLERARDQAIYHLREGV